MKPRLVPSQQTENYAGMKASERTISQLLDDWYSIDRQIADYVSGQSNSDESNKSTKSIGNEEAELVRLTEKQQKLLEEIVEIACQTKTEVLDKLKLWESCVVSDEASAAMQSTDHLVLSALRDFERLSETFDSQLSLSSTGGIILD